jgi:glutamate synthase (NADPH/NADH) small chain
LRNPRLSQAPSRAGSRIFDRSVDVSAAHAQILIKSDRKVKFFIDARASTGDILISFAKGAWVSDIESRFADAHPPLTHAQAVVEANRCYFCHDAPCIQACPTDIDVPGFIRGIATGNLAGAARKILEQNIFGGACARVCPTEILCERACVWTEAGEQPIAIGALQRVATDWQMAQGEQPFIRAAPTGKKIAVVGAGPAGLSCAHALALRGHEVRVFDAKPKPGGLNEYGIAAYKMADAFAAREVEFIISIGGIDIEYDRELGETLNLAALRMEYDAVFLGLGQTAVNRMGIPGEDLPGIHDAVDFIAELRQAEDKATLNLGRRVIVIGGGNTAIDAATQARLLGAEEVTILYRRGPEHMSATPEEQRWARQHGVNIHFHAAPLRVEQVEGALRILTAGQNFVADTVLKAVGQKFAGLDGVRLENGRIAVDAVHTTSLAGVFAGGDCVAGQDLTVRAVQDGKLAARAIHAFLGF